MNTIWTKISNTVALMMCLIKKTIRMARNGMTFKEIYEANCKDAEKQMNYIWTEE